MKSKIILLLLFLQMSVAHSQTISYQATKLMSPGSLPEIIENGHIIKVYFNDGTPERITRMGQTYRLSFLGTDNDDNEVYRLVNNSNSLIFNLTITKNYVFEEYIYGFFRIYTYYERIRN